MSEYHTDTFGDAVNPRMLQTMPLTELNPASLNKFIDGIGVIEEQYYVN